jgi:pimeloyl-ACP methyl ester carboxylesterase
LRHILDKFFYPRGHASALGNKGDDVGGWHLPLRKKFDAAMTLKSDTKPVVVKVGKPRGTIYWGGAGLDGAYIAPQLKAFQEAGIAHVWSGLTNTATKDVGAAVGTIVDAIRAGISIRYEDNAEWIISKGMDNPVDQFNLIGYSYGSLLAAQTAYYYSKQNHIVNHLVLVGSPIDAGFLEKLQSHKNIKKVVVINLGHVGDPIYAGMPQTDLIAATVILGNQMRTGKGEGHFYYAHVVSASLKRWAGLAKRIYGEGVR